VPQHHFGDAADEQPTQARPPVRAHDDQVTRPGLGGLENLGRRVAFLKKVFDANPGFRWLEAAELFEQSRAVAAR
jgi:hypothetical protein